MSESIDLTSPPIGGGAISATANSNISNSNPTNLGNNLDAWAHMTSFPMGSINTHIPDEKTPVQEGEIVDYEKQLTVLTLGCITACRPLQATLTSSSSGQFISALFGSYVVNRGGKTHTQKIGVATLNTTLPLALHLAVAELLAAFYMQWHWWNERTDFTTP